MKAKLVQENINFGRGLETKEAIGIGQVARSKEFIKFMEEELEWNGAKIEYNEDLGGFLYTCYPGNSVDSDIEDAANDFGWEVEVENWDDGSREEDDGSMEHEYLIKKI